MTILCNVLFWVQDGDMIEISAENDSISLLISDAEMEQRRAAWTPPPMKYTRGVLGKYARTVSSAHFGAVTDY